MDLIALAQQLIDEHGKRTARLSPLIRNTAQTHYRDGVQECLDLMKRAALAEEQAPRASISGPLAVQPSHSAVSGPPPHHDQLEEG